MASPQQEIQQLRRQIADANRTIQENESRNQAALCRTITELQKQYEKARNDQQQDYAARLRRIEESFSNVYIREAERSRQQYQALREKAEAYEQQLSEQIRALQNEQDRLIAEADARNFALRQKAQKALTGLERQIADACALPVDVFFPHCIQHYIEAGEEAKALLQARLYTLALSKADCARLFVTRLTSETQARQNELEALFLLYRQSYEVICSISILRRHAAYPTRTAAFFCSSVSRTPAIGPISSTPNCPPRWMATVPCWMQASTAGSKDAQVNRYRLRFCLIKRSRS